MIIYLLKSGLLLVVFYGVYKILLESEKMFRFNRAYLLVSIVFSLLIPLQLFSLGSVFSNKIKIIQLEGIMIEANKVVSDKINYSEMFVFLLELIYLIIAAILVLRFVRNVYSFYIKTKKSKVEILKGQKIVLTKESILPHSFWNAIFVNQEDFKNGKIPLELIAHEKAHLQQKHTLDILFIEFLQIVFWFNPMFVLYEKAIKLNHEFLADEAVNQQFGEIRNYQNLILDFASHKNTVTLASNINYLITKKRLLMMTKKESTIKMILKISSATAACVFLLFAFNTEAIAQTSSSEKIQNETKDNNSNESEPQFPGGMIEFYKFVGKNFKTPTEASVKKIEGKLYVEFMVEKDGSLSEINVVKDLGYGLGDELVRVLKLSPKWNAGIRNGQPVSVLYTLPITIQAEK